MGARGSKSASSCAQQLVRPLVEVLPVDLAGQGLDLLVADEDVLRDGEVRVAGDVLVDGRDAEPLGIRGAVDLHRCAVEEDLAGVGLVDAGDHLDEGGLARAVLPDERVDLPVLQVEMHVVQRFHAREGLCDVRKLKDAVSHFDGLLSTDLQTLDFEEMRELVNPVGEVPDADGAVVGGPRPGPAVRELPGRQREAVPAVGVADLEGRTGNRLALRREKECRCRPCPGPRKGASRARDARSSGWKDPLPGLPWYTGSGTRPTGPSAIAGCAGPSWPHRTTSSSKSTA